jgi:hypothetical protein
MRRFKWRSFTTSTWPSKSRRQLPTKRSAIPFLPRTLKARSLGLNTKALHGINHIVIEARAANEDQMARRGVVRKRFP